MFVELVFRAPVAYFTIVAVVMVSIVLHELGHGLAATWEGDPTPRLRGHLTWNPVVHMGWFAIVLLLVAGISAGRTPVNPSYFRNRRWGNAFVSLAGPIVNLSLAFAGLLILHAMRRSGADSDARWIWEVIVRLNVTLFLLNMIPVPPLDGFSVADSLFDLGRLGDVLRSLGGFGLLIAILVVNSDFFDAAIDWATRAMSRVAAMPFQFGG